MEFTWGHVFLLAKKMFHYSDNDVAQLLGISRTTVYRHIKEKNRRKFRIPKDIYKALFKQSDRDVKILLADLKETLDKEDFPTSVRGLEFSEYEPYIRHLLKLAKKAESEGQPTPLPKQDSLDYGEQSTSDLAIDNIAKEVRSVWDSNPPEPVFMPEEFYKCFDKYAIADFLELDPTNLILINYMLAKEKPDGEAMIKNAIQFVKDTEDAMQRAEISIWNEKVRKAISAFTKSLREYIDFLLENAERPDFTISPFLFGPIDADEFERKEIWHRKKLRSICRQIANVEGRWHGLQMYAYFPGQ